MNDNWLTLNEAADRLGVHPDTLRRWADGGKIPVFKTPGGHRRFSRDEIASFGRERLRVQIEAGLRETLARGAITNTREEIASRSAEPWLAKLTDEQKRASRELGHQVLNVCLDHLTAVDGRNLLPEAQRLGCEYGAHGKEFDLPLAQMIRAAMVFRNSLVETILGLPEEDRDERLTSRLLLRLNEVMDTVQLAVVTEYDEVRT